MKATTAIVFFSGAALATGLWAAPTSANPLVTETIVQASDADLDDRLGQAVSIDGNVGIAGANRNNDAGPNSGATYLFDARTGAELHKLTASDAEERDIFGHSVGISGNTAIVSAQSSDDAGDRSGSAYLFDVTTGQELFKLTASDAAEGDFFGHGIGISGNIAIVGAHGDDDLGSVSGSAYLFDVATGNELRKLTASDGAAGDQFGYWAAIDGNVAIVGAKYDDHAGFRSGSAYLFDVTTGEELHKLTASDTESGDQFGYAVAIEGNTAVVGAWHDNDAGFDSGSVYVFDVTTGNELLKITASDASARDYFGYAFDISDNTLLVGAYGDDGEDGDSPNAGSVYLYDLTFGDELVKLTASDAGSGDEFGTAVGLSDKVGFVGSWQSDGEVADIGRGYLFDVSAVLPPGADFNDDGVVDDDDLLLWERMTMPRLDANDDDHVGGTDFILWQQRYSTETALDASVANFDQQGAVDGADLSVWEQSHGVDDAADADNDEDSDGPDFLSWQQMLTPFDGADGNQDQLVDGVDLELWGSSFGWEQLFDSDGNLVGDANGDDLITELDYLWWREQSISVGSATISAQVPEPATILLFTGCLVGCILGRMRPKY